MKGEFCIQYETFGNTYCSAHLIATSIDAVDPSNIVSSDAAAMAAEEKPLYENSIQYAA